MVDNFADIMKYIIESEGTPSVSRGKKKRVVLKKESTMKTVTPTSEDEDWMHSLPGYQDEGSL